MKKCLSIIFVFAFMLTSVTACYALNIGTYKSESEYGLFDGFKVNWKRKDKSQPFIEPREESTNFEKQKELNYYKETEYERTKFMYDGKAIL